MTANRIASPGRRERLENELAAARHRLDNAPKDTPKEVLEGLRKEYDGISFELDNLYDDPETESE